MVKGKLKATIWLTPSVKDKVEDNFQSDNCKSQSEFIERAIEFYVGYLNTKNASAFLPEALSATLTGTLDGFAGRISSLLFKQGVDINLMAQIIAYDTDIDEGAYHFFTMGGAKSHDTEDGILEPGTPDFEQKLLMLQRKPRARYRINHISWWAQEMPSEEEYAETRRNLTKVDWSVDYVITHCAPTSIALMENRHNEADSLTDFLQEVKEKTRYHYWLFGHYHDNRAIDEKHILLWEQIVQVI